MIAHASTNNTKVPPVSIARLTPSVSPLRAVCQSRYCSGLVGKVLPLIATHRVHLQLLRPEIHVQICRWTGETICLSKLLWQLHGD